MGKFIGKYYKTKKVICDDSIALLYTAKYGKKFVCAAETGMCVFGYHSTKQNKKIVTRIKQYNSGKLAKEAARRFIIIESRKAENDTRKKSAKRDTEVSV